MLDLTPEPWEAAVLDRLKQAPPNLDALLELFELVSPAVWGYALHRCRDQQQAMQVATKAFLTAAHNPTIFDNRRVSIRIRMLLLVHLDTPRRSRWPRLPVRWNGPLKRSMAFG